MDENGEDGDDGDACSTSYPSQCALCRVFLIATWTQKQRIRSRWRFAATGIVAAQRTAQTPTITAMGRPVAFESVHVENVARARWTALFVLWCFRTVLRRSGRHFEFLCVSWMRLIWIHRAFISIPSPLHFLGRSRCHRCHMLRRRRRLRICVVLPTRQLNRVLWWSTATTIDHHTLSQTRIASIVRTTIASWRALRVSASTCTIQ